MLIICFLERPFAGESDINGINIHAKNRPLPPLLTNCHSAQIHPTTYPVRHDTEKCKAVTLPRKEGSLFLRSSFALASLYLRLQERPTSDAAATLLWRWCGAKMAVEKQVLQLLQCYCSFTYPFFCGKDFFENVFFTNPCVVHGKNVYLQSGNQHSHWAPRHKTC